MCHIRSGPTRRLSTSPCRRSFSRASCTGRGLPWMRRMRSRVWNSWPGVLVSSASRRASVPERSISGMAGMIHLYRLLIRTYPRALIYLLGTLDGCDPVMQPMNSAGNANQPCGSFIGPKLTACTTKVSFPATIQIGMKILIRGSSPRTG